MPDQNFIAKRPNPCFRTFFRHIPSKGSLYLCNTLCPTIYIWRIHPIFGRARKSALGKGVMNLTFSNANWPWQSDNGPRQ